MVFSQTVDGVTSAYPDTLVGTDSHTTMVNGLGVVGWGVGGIEAEAAMLGQPISMLIPQVVGFRLTGAMPQGATATDLVLTITEVLRKHGVVGKFVEFFGEGLSALTIADRATLGNMCPEYGATVAIFPIDEMTLDYLRLTGRDGAGRSWSSSTRKSRGCSGRRTAPDAVYSEVVELDLATIEPSLAGPKRPQDRVSLKRAKTAFQAALPTMQVPSKPLKGASAAEGGAPGCGAAPARGAIGRRGRRSGARRAGSRRRGDRRDHQLHEHLQPERDDRRRPAGEEGGREGPDAETVGQEQPGAGVEGGHRVSRTPPG